MWKLIWCVTACTLGQGGRSYIFYADRAQCEEAKQTMKDAHTVANCAWISPGDPDARGKKLMPSRYREYLRFPVA
jgi:hypothetical protein